MTSEALQKLFEIEHAGVQFDTWDEYAKAKLDWLEARLNVAEDALESHIATCEHDKAYFALGHIILGHMGVWTLTEYVDAVIELLETFRVEEPKWRRFLWLNHGCPPIAVYGDDGEMQCGACGIDFKRRSADEIRESFIRKNQPEIDKFFERLLNAEKV
jgi:hypothetical protein